MYNDFTRQTGHLTLTKGTSCGEKKVPLWDWSWLELTPLIAPQTKPVPQGNFLFMSATHTELGDAYYKKNKDTRIYVRGAFYGYEKGVWVLLPNIKHEFWMSIKFYKGADPTSSLVNSVMSYVEGLLYKKDEVMDAHPGLLNLKNGILNIETKKLIPHSFNYYFTTQLGFEYNPKAKCPMWNKYISEALVNLDLETDKQMIDFIQEAFGYSMTDSVEHEISFWLIGEGATGKSTMIYVLEHLAGSASLALNLGVLERDKYQLASLGGKRIVVCTEAPDTTVADAILKGIISGDTINVRAPYGAPFVVTPTAKVWWAMNNPPRVNDTSEGFWRKMKVIPFNRQFVNGDRNKKLKYNLAQKELSGIFNWALIGLERLRKNEEFSESDQIEDATLQYREESDLTKQFVTECCALNPSGYTPSAELYEAYRVWCKANEHKPVSHNRVARDWRRLKLKRGKDPKDVRVWFGVELLEAPDPYKPKK